MSKPTEIWTQKSVQPTRRRPRDDTLTTLSCKLTLNLLVMSDNMDLPDSETGEDNIQSRCHHHAT
jgi:hypothetical protein